MNSSRDGVTMFVSCSWEARRWALGVCWMLAPAFYPPREILGGIICREKKARFSMIHSINYKQLFLIIWGHVRKGKCQGKAHI